MKIPFHSLIVLIAFLFSGCTTIKKPFFYEVSNKWTKAYVLGTIHTGVPVQDLPNHVTEKFNESRVFLFEIDPTSPTSIMKNASSILDGVDSALKAVGDQTVVQQHPRLSQQTWQQVALQPGGFFYGQSATAQHYSPQLMYYLILSKDERTIEVSRATAKRYDPEYSMDLNLISEARKQRKRLIELDDKKSLPTTCEDLVYDMALRSYSTKSLESHFEDLEVIVNSYRSGDEMALNNQVQKSFGAYPQVQQCLLTKRNEIWYNNLYRDLETHSMVAPAFIAVGAAHLVGPGNLLEIFQKNGYTVKIITEE